ncbi:hypothetical protein [Actinotalea sp.]|uniref:hypothetical protein n=1 Tax=Actinotalea sp. TaxID=1872145 RepID=UPI0035671AB0
MDDDLLIQSSSLLRRCSLHAEHDVEMALTADPLRTDDGVLTDADDVEVRPRRTVWTVVTGALGAIGGIAPHVLHHVGPLVGTALVAGAGGTALFGVLGLALSVPMFLTLRRRFGSWWAPGIALAAFTAMFLVSSLLIGPLISGSSPPPADQSISDHETHHR